MAACSECGKKFGYFEDVYGSNSDLCWKCHRQEENLLENVAKAEEKQQRATEKQQRATDKKVSEQLSRQIEATLLTTETAPNLNITKRIDVISAQAAFEINNFKDIFVGFVNPVKGRSNELEKQLDELRVKSTQNLKAKAHEIGANGIVAVDLDLSTVTIGGISMMMMMASGTAVVIETEEGAL